MGLDEGMPSATDEFRVFYTERIKTSATFSVRGTTGHGSQFLESTAGEKVARLLSAVYSHRDRQLQTMRETGNENVGVANLTIINGGLQGNVVCGPSVDSCALFSIVP